MTTFNTPTIWTPRSGPWWRLPRWADIAQYAKKLQFKDGKLAFKNGKPVITEEGNPCCCHVCPEVVFSGTKLLACSSSSYGTIINCGPSSFDTGWITSSQESYDGTYSLCANPYLDTTTTTLYYRQGACDGDIRCSLSGLAITLSLVISSGTATATVIAVCNQSSGKTGSSARYFDGSDSATEGDPIIIANNLPMPTHRTAMAENIGTATVIY